MLRVISGLAKGHKLKTIKGNTTRPTSDRVKEALFNILAGKVEGMSVLDLYAGTGSLGIEALSRGAFRAVFIDRSNICCSTIKDNLIHTGFDDKALVINNDIVSALKKMSENSAKFDIIFLDPPYRKNLVIETLNYIVKNDIINSNSIVVAEHDMTDKVPERVEGLELIRSAVYGGTVISFYRPGAEVIHGT